MKRSVALLLTVIMVLGMIPASLLSAMAHGIGVGNNATGNLSIENAPNQQVPATVIVDGKSNDTAWAYEDWNKVDSTTGLWSVTTAKNPNFNYKYQLHFDYQFLYGVFVIDSNSLFSGTLGDITVWINDSGKTTYTDKIVLTKDGTIAVYDGSGNVISDTGATSYYGTDIYSQFCAVENNDGVYTVEFRTLLKNITDKTGDDVALKSYVSVDAIGKSGDIESLYYPRFAFETNNIDPVALWPTNSVTISRWETTASHQNGEWGTQNGDFSKIVPSEFTIDGELDEPFWQSFTDYYRQDNDPYSYVTNNATNDGYNLVDLTVGYSGSMYYYGIEDGYVNQPRENSSGEMALNDPITFSNYSITTSDSNKWMYDANYLDLYSSPLKFKYDIRSDEDYLYGAVLANVDCSNEDIYYHIKKYEDEHSTIANGTTLIVPIFFHVVFDAGYKSSTHNSSTQNTAYSLKLMYNTEVVYNSTLGTWEFSGVYGKGHNEVIYGYSNDGRGSYLSGPGDLYPINDDGTNPVNEKGEKPSAASYINNNFIESVISAKRLNRYLISFEFKLSYQMMGLKDQNGKYYKDGKYTEDQYAVKHTVAMTNVPGMYDRYPVDVAASTGTTSKSITFYSFGYIDETTGEAVEYKEGDKGKYNGKTAELSKFPGKYCVFESAFNFTYYNTFDLGYYAYSAWSQGGGNAQSVPVIASKNSTTRTPSDLKIDGVLESTYWANILAADVIINGMGRSINVDSDNDNIDFTGKGEENASDGVLGTFYHELAMDDEYLYGAAVLIDGDKEWKTKTGSSTSTDYDVFRLWIQSGSQRYAENINYIANFYIDKTVHTSKNLAVCDITTSANKKIATSVSLTDANADVRDEENTINKAGYGIEVGMKVVSGYTLREITDSTAIDKGNATYTTDVAVLEFKIPLSLLGIDSESYDAMAFNYVASMERMADGGNQGLVWPLYDNAKAIKEGHTSSTINGDINTLASVAKSLADKYSIAGLMASDRSASTLILDGGLFETVWDDKEDLIDVNINTGTPVGTWVESPSTTDCFGYSHKIWTGREYIYGGVIVDAELTGTDNFVLWINANEGNKATHKFEFMIENGETVCYKTDLATSNRTKVTFTDYITNAGKSYEAKDGGAIMNIANGKTYLEFKLPIEEFQDITVQTTTNGSYEYNDGYKYVISVNHTASGKVYTLYYPDNSNVGNSETTTLWLTHYNIQTNGSGTIVYSPKLAQGMASNFWRQVYFSPTEWEGIYRCDGYQESEEVSGYNTLYDAWRAIYPNGIPEGAFVYCTQSSNAAGITTDNGKVSGLNYNCMGMNTIRDRVGYKVGCYVRFDGIDLSGDNKIVTPYDDRISRKPKYFQAGYCTNATFTVVTLDNNVKEEELPENKFGLEYQLITFVGYYIPEDIYIDGAVNDTGWSKDGWTYVVDGANGNTNNFTFKNCDTDFSYKYQIRMDDKYVYVAAVADGLSAYSTATAIPAFRIWIQSKDSEYADAVSFTHFFDVRALAQGGTGTNLYSKDNANLTTNINAQINAYQAHYMPENEGVGATVTVDGKAKNFSYKGDFGNYNWTYVGIPESVLRAATHNGYKKPQGGLNNTVDNLTYGDTAFYGEPVFHAENQNKGNEDQEYQGKWFADIKLTEVELADQHAIMTQDASGNMQVEFRFALEDIGCEDGDEFEYYVETRSETNEPGTSYCLYYPALPFESGSYNGNYSRTYNLPYWYWSDTAMVVDAEAREAMRLRNPLEPITSVGAQVMEDYNGEGYNALKFGVLYDHKYLGYVNGRTEWSDLENDIYDGATYWDVKEIGIILDETDALWLETEGGKKNGKTELYIGTSEYVQNIPSDQIDNQASGTNMADYENYVSYIVAKVPAGYEDIDLTYRGYVEYYPHDDLYYDHWWLTDSTLDDPKEGEEDPFATGASEWTYRPTYYCDPLTRSYNLVKEKSDENTEIVVPVDDILVNITINNYIQHIGHEVLDENNFVVEIGNENGSMPYIVNDGELNFSVPYSKEDVGVHTYTIRQKNENQTGVTYDGTEYTVTINVAFDEDANILIPTITVNNNVIGGNSIELDYTVKYDYTKNNTKVVYVPLDNRPVNLDRAEYLAESAGIDLILPPENLVSTSLTTSTAYGSTESDQGDVAALFDWLKEQDADYYALSLDSLLSGGLVGSRAPFYDTQDSIASLNQTLGNYNLSAKEQEIIEYLTELANTDGKYVVFFDTIMRLASTNAYAGMNMTEYNYLRYQFSLEDRTDLTGSDLTINNIVANYQYGTNGSKLTNVFNKQSLSGKGYEGYGSTVSQTVVDNYCLARERKLRIADALYGGVINSIDAMFIGVDDSMGEETIHTNEMNYLKQEYSIDSRDNTLLFDGADELGLVALANVVSELHNSINVYVQYFGGYENSVADDYGPGTLKESVDKHIKASGANLVTNASNADMQVLVVTRPFDEIKNFYASGSEGYDTHVTNCTNLVNKLKANLDNDIPTCVIDGTSYRGYGPLADKILAEADAGNLALAEVMGFSAWNTSGNAVGISLGNAISRVAYLKNYSVVPNENYQGNKNGVQNDSHTGFYKSILYSYIKDAVYKKNNSAIFNQHNKFMSLAENWIKAINKNTGMYTSINSNGKGVVNNANQVRVNEITFPWNRSFEADFDFEFYALGTEMEVELTPDKAEGMSYNCYNSTGGNAIIGGSYADEGKTLTDGAVLGSAVTYGDTKWVGFESNNNGRTTDVVFNFASPLDVYKVSAQVMTEGIYGIMAPETYEVYIQREGSSEWILVNKLTSAQGHYTRGTAANEASVKAGWVGGFISGDGSNATAVKVRFTGTSAYIFVAEINIQGLYSNVNRTEAFELN